MKTRITNYKADRLSNLPDCILLRILSFLIAKQVVQTSILSTRWKHIWKYLPTINIGFLEFNTITGLSKFVRCILSRRDASTSLDTLNCRSIGIMHHRLFQWILNYAFSHNVERLSIDVHCDILPDCIFSCHSLTSLDFCVSTEHSKVVFPSSLNFPLLTNLSLGFGALLGGVDHFSTFPSLKRLDISYFQIFGEQNLCISNTTLVELEITTDSDNLNRFKIELSTPSLRTFVFEGAPFQILSGSRFGSLKHVTIYFDEITDYEEDSLIILNSLQELVDIESLTMYSNTLQVLSLVPNVLEVKLNSLRKLKSLGIKVKGISSTLSKHLIDAKLAQHFATSHEEVAKLRETFKEGSSTVPFKIVRFLLQNSPSAIVHLVR